MVNKMNVFAFISRHEPTKEQLQMAFDQGILLDPIGDMDAFSVVPDHLKVFGDYDGVVVVHPAMALRLIDFFDVGVFENEMRPELGGKPSFSPKKLHVFNKYNFI